MRAGHAPPMSSKPEAMACRAVATSWILAAWKVGMPRRAPDLSGEIQMRRRRAMPLDRDDIRHRGSVWIRPRMTFRKSTCPVFTQQF